MTLTAALLTGGLSRRMGKDKATLTLAGEPLWQRQLSLLRKLQPGELWISARTRPVWSPSEMEVVLDEPPSRGPLSGLAATLGKLRTSHLLALAVDLPQLTTAHLQTLVALARQGQGVVPLSGDGFEPLCAVYPIEAAQVAVDALNGGDLSLQPFIETLFRQNRVRTYRLDKSEQFLYHNANTPAELAKCDT